MPGTIRVLVPLVILIMMFMSWQNIFARKSRTPLSPHNDCNYHVFTFI